MKLFKYPLLRVGVAYFLILLSIAFYVRDIPNQQDAFNTIQQLVNPGVMQDPASFATAAIDVAENGWISSANEWILNLWPPGFILLEASIVKIFGPEVPLILVLQILAAVLFSVMLVLLHELLSTYVKRSFAFTLPLLIFAFPVSRVFLLEPTGVTLGESFAIGFFLLCILLAFRSVRSGLLRYAAYAGVCLALSAYFRSQFEIILLVLTGWGVLMIAAITLTRLRNSIEPKLLKSIIKTIAVALLVAHAATIPWRAYHWIYQGSLSWVSTSALTFRNSVMSSDALESIGGGFVVVGAGNLVCRIDPTSCGDETNAKKLFIKTFINNPYEWYTLKFDVIGNYWFSSVKNWTNVRFKSTAVDTVTNGLLLIALMALVCLLFTKKVRSHDSWILLVWFNATLFSAYTLIFTLAHFEVRYFYFPKIAGMMMFLIVACLYCRPMKKIGMCNE